MKQRLRIEWPPAGAWLHVALLTGACILTLMIVTCPDVLLMPA